MGDEQATQPVEATAEKAEEVCGECGQPLPSTLAEKTEAAPETQAEDDEVSKEA